MSSTQWVRHPWFDTFGTKRKLQTTDFPDIAPFPTVKRRKCSTLEHGFAHLSLTHSSEDMDTPMYSDTISDKVVLSTSVEEPTDVKMRTSTWYEPEPDRIVITELESSSDEEQDLKCEARDEGQFYVSPILLNSIRSRTFSSPKDPSGQALVLFRPLQLPSPVRCSDTAPKNSSISESAVTEEEDIMDVEP